MSSKPSRAKPLESPISICLLVILVLIAVGILLRQRDVDMSRFGIDATTVELLTQKKEEIALGPLAPSGFQAPSPTQTYTADNLYEKINGKADFYLDSGFKKLSTQRFMSKDNNGLWFELYVYDMVTTRNAFSVFSVQRRPDAVASGTLDPQYAYRTANALYYINGHYYIELTGSAESNELFEAMLEIRDKLRKNLAVDMVTQITELTFFPRENLIPKSVKLYLEDAFAFEGLTDTFAAQYQIGDEAVTAFFSRRPDTQNARKIAQGYYDFLIDNGGVEKPVPSAARYTGKVVDFYGTTEIVFATGLFVAGVHECENEQLAHQLAAILFNKLTGVERQ
ncbi:MAG: DUF6599 family protein [Planctomycetota bacterium]|jgi:hypothetical protein